MKKPKHTKRVARLPLPWERGSRPLRAPLSGRRLLPLFAAAAGLALLYATYVAGDRRADLSATRATLAEVDAATRAFVGDLGRCPEDTSELVHPPKSGLHYLTEPPLDAWGRAPQLRCTAGEHTEVEVLSAGPSGSFLDDDNVM
ncbi:MAG: type II secretion system protein GspG [Polyangiales bacterium]